MKRGVTLGYLHHVAAHVIGIYADTGSLLRKRELNLPLAQGPLCQLAICDIDIRTNQTRPAPFIRYVTAGLDPSHRAVGANYAVVAVVVMSTSRQGQLELFFKAAGRPDGRLRARPRGWFLRCPQASRE